MKGLVIAAPQSGAGKTMITLGLLRALRDRGIRVAGAKSGPDYIDPQFHFAACGQDSVNLDAWAMPPAMLRGLAACQGADLLLIEGAMGLHDGAMAAGNPLGQGSVAELAATLDLPVVLVLDCAKQAQTAAAVVLGLASLRRDIRIVGVILNRVGSDKHVEMVSLAVEAAGFAVLGHVGRQAGLETPSRHLGLVQALERSDVDDFCARAARIVAAGVDLDRIFDGAGVLGPEALPESLPPLGQRIAVARDQAFAFAYPHILNGWRLQGAELSFFSPLADEAPAPDADAVYLPGGYPELHADRLASAARFRAGMQAAAQGARIYGECGGYMTLGRSLIDAQGRGHEMLGLLPVDTSFAARALHLGYRRLTPLQGTPWSLPLAAHEFHYATVADEAMQHRLFDAEDSVGRSCGPIGHWQGNVSGSFAHVIAPAR